MHARLEGEPGLLALRKRRARKVDEVVSELAERLDVADVPRLKRYSQRLEGGTLDPGRVDQREMRSATCSSRTSEGSCGP
jgi:hypothetical protein